MSQFSKVVLFTLLAAMLIGLGSGNAAAQPAMQTIPDALARRLETGLQARLQWMGDGERLTVAVWLRGDQIKPLERPEVMPQAEPDVEMPAAEMPRQAAGGEEEKQGAENPALLQGRVEAIRQAQAGQRAAIQAHKEANAAHLASQVAAVQAPLLAELEARGYKPAHISPVAPLLYVELPKEDILALAGRQDIDMIYGPHQSHDMMDNAKPTHKANVIDAWGFDGTGIDLAILEDSRVAFNNPYLNDGTTRVPGDANVDYHATACAGMVASQHTTYQGIAQGVALFSANATDYDDANLSAAMDWAASTQGVDIINNSWGNDSGTGLTEHDRHLDYIVRNLYKTVTVSAGNDGTVSGKVGSPGRAFNVITVGNFQDHNTLTWDDDDMRPSSSYIDPDTNVEKPEVAASGTSINSTSEASPWVGDMGSGTSYSAPMVAAEAALLMDRESVLETWPEIVKAVILATALNNIEGDSRLSEYDGTGGVDMRAAFRVVDEVWFSGNQVNTNSFPYTRTVYLSAGQVVRAAIAWDSNPNAAYTTDPLQANLSLYAYSPSGSQVASSTSSSNPYEIVEFTASTSGNYDLVVKKVSFSGTSEYVGMAWWPGYRELISSATMTFGTPVVSHDYYLFDASSGWNALGIRSPSSTDYDIAFYHSSAFGDPEDYDWLEDSATSWDADFILVDGNHAAADDYFAEVIHYSGTGGSYPAQFVYSTGVYGHSTIYGPYTLAANDVLEMWQFEIATGDTLRVEVLPTSGTSNVGIALFDSHPSTSSTWYQGRSDAIVTEDAHAGGQGETLKYTNSGSTDRFGLAVYKNDNNTLTFYLKTGNWLYLPLVRR